MGDIDETGKEKFVERALEKYQKDIDKISKKMDKFRGRVENNPKLDQFIEKHVDHGLKHQKILQKLEKKLPPQAWENLAEARNQSLKNIGKVLSKMKNKEESLSEKIDCDSFQEGTLDVKDVKESVRKLKEEMTGCECWAEVFVDPQPSIACGEKGNFCKSCQEKIKIIDKIFAGNPKAVEDALLNDKADHFLIGLLMKATKGKADPSLANRIVKEKLSLLKIRKA